MTVSLEGDELKEDLEGTVSEGERFKCNALHPLTAHPQIQESRAACRA